MASIPYREQGEEIASRIKTCTLGERVQLRQIEFLTMTFVDFGVLGLFDIDRDQRLGARRYKWAKCGIDGDSGGRRLAASEAQQRASQRQRSKYSSQVKNLSSEKYAARRRAQW